MCMSAQDLGISSHLWAQFGHGPDMSLKTIWLGS